MPLVKGRESPEDEEDNGAGALTTFFAMPNETSAVPRRNKKAPVAPFKPERPQAQGQVRLAARVLGLRVW